MLGFISSYTRWLHTRWPAGGVEKLPVVNADGTTAVPGLYVVGDLSGVPLLKLSINAGVNAVRKIAGELKEKGGSEIDVAIVGGGAAGMAAALEAGKLGLNYRLFEASEPFSTIVNFPKAKPIYTYPTDLELEGDIRLHEKSKVKEGLLEDLREQTIDAGVRWEKRRISHVERAGGMLELVPADQGERVRAKRVIVAIGRSGNYRKLGVPGEEKPKVYNRLHDPADFCGQDVLVVGGGDSALETAIALAQCGARVTLSYRKPEFNRPKPGNIDKINAFAIGKTDGVTVEQSSDPRVSPSMPADMQSPQGRGSIELLMSSSVGEIRDGEVDIKLADGSTKTKKNDAVFIMIGREAPLDFFRRSGVPIVGERNAKWWITLVVMLLTFTFLYQVKKPGTFLPIAEWWQANNLFPHNLGPILERVSNAFADPSTLLGTIRYSAAGVEGKTGSSPGFWFSLMYTTLIVVFGIRRIRRRKTPYITIQTLSLMAFQVIPLFLLPYILLPWLGHNGAFDSGFLKTVADNLFPVVDYDPHGREYWRAFGLILAWPLFIWNVFSGEPLWWWLAISLVQTFVLIPALIYFFGKGVYCGWVCSCGAMAETLGDTHRHKMPHGPMWNRLNMIGQVFLFFALGLLALRIVGWILPGDDTVERAFNGLLNTYHHGGFLPALNYAWFVDLFWAGILGFGLYFNFSGRVWCRFACPLAALMHIYARFSRFAIVPEKKKCISCNVCTSVCHQGIDVMSFANKGVPMQDPECVRCSACVQSCPTGVLSFGQVDKAGATIKLDPDFLAASPVRIREIAAVKLTVKGKALPL